MAGLNVSGDLLRSIFEPSLPIPELYVVILRAMAKLADRDGGRELSAAPIHIADLAGIDHRLKQEQRGGIVETAISEMIKVGIVELVSEEIADCYRFPNRHDLTEIAKKILRGRVHLPPIHIPL